MIVAKPRLLVFVRACACATYSLSWIRSVLNDSIRYRTVHQLHQEVSYFRISAFCLQANCPMITTIITVLLLTLTASPLRTCDIARLVSRDHGYLHRRPTMPPTLNPPPKASFKLLNHVMAVAVAVCSCTCSCSVASIEIQPRDRSSDPFQGSGQRRRVCRRAPASARHWVSQPFHHASPQSLRRAYSKTTHRDRDIHRMYMYMYVVLLIGGMICIIPGAVSPL
jgi:hypothetical protein